MSAKTYQSMSIKLQSAYRNNLYHTSIHAADVLQSVFYYLNGWSAHQICAFDTFDLASLFLASAAHDMEHPGNNNVFEMKTHSKIA